MIRQFFAPLAMKVAGGIIAVLALACAILWWSNSRKDSQIEDLQQTLAVSEAQHDVTVASLDALTRRMQELVRDGELRRGLLQAAISDAKAEAADLQDEADALRSEAIEDQCVTPAGVLKSRGL